MKITDLYESDIEHGEALEKTGYWGKAGAGAIIFSRKTKRFLIGLRSRLVEQPHTWGTFGGAIDPNENVKNALLREIKEELSKDLSDSEIISLYRFEDKSVGFVYYNFLLIVEDEFNPILDWENDDAQWFNFGEWPKPLHFGLEKVLNDSYSKNLLRNISQ